MQMRYRPNPWTVRVNSDGVSAFRDGHETGWEVSGNWRRAAVEDGSGKGLRRQNEICDAKGYSGISNDVFIPQIPFIPTDE